MEDGWWSECYGKLVNIVFYKYFFFKILINVIKI